MKEHDKINVAAYLRDLNQRAKYACVYGTLRKSEYIELTCKELACKCNVTPATISNLNTSSSFYLIHKIAGEILDAYFAVLAYETRKNVKDNPEDLYVERETITYVMYELTEFFSDEWLNY